MVNFRVVRIGDLVKFLVKVVILIFGIILLTRFFSFIKKINFNEYVENRKLEIENRTFFELLEENLGGNNIRNEVEKQNLLSEELDSSVISAFILKENDEAQELDRVAIETYEEIDDVVTDDVPKDVGTQVVSENNKNDVYNASFGSVQIRNQTSFNLTGEMLTPDISFDTSNIVIFHTHTSESYTPSENYQYIATGNFRTSDTRCSVVGVGDELASWLTRKGINVIHDSTFHDYPEYNGAYTRSLQTVRGILANNPADLVIDLHRDAIADSSYGPSVMIGDERVAQLMFVMGSSEGGLEHPDWVQNLKVAIKIQEKANEMYPGLFKPILISKYRYNEHVAKRGLYY